MLGTADLAKRLGRVGILPVYPRNSRMNPKEGGLPKPAAGRPTSSLPSMGMAIRPRAV